MKNYYIELLSRKYNKTSLTRAEIAKELNISISSLDNLIEKNQLDIRYHRIGNSQKARYIFPIIEVANFLSFEAYHQKIA